MWSQGFWEAGFWGDGFWENSGQGPVVVTPTITIVRSLRLWVVDQGLRAWSPETPTRTLRVLRGARVNSVTPQVRSLVGYSSPRTWKLNATARVWKSESSNTWDVLGEYLNWRAL